MTPIRGICDLIRSSTDEILELWEEQTRREPWLRLPEGARLDHIPELLDSLVDAVVCTPDPESSRRHAVQMAARHGAQRASAGFDDTILYKEYHLLRACVWTIVERTHPGEEQAIEVISRMDMVITTATTGSLHGFHHEVVGETGPEARDLGGVVERVLDAGTWPPPLDGD